MTLAIPEKESLIVEFKSDRERLPDRELVAAAVCLANTEGGEIYLGVEKGGTITGLHPEHQSLTGLATMIANRTNPPLSVRVEPLDISGRRVAKIIVPKSRRLVATSEGLLQRRRLMADGTPQCVPYVKTHGKITRKDAVTLCRISEDQASRLLRRLHAENKLVMRGKGRGAFYAMP